ncbi:hydroxyacid dehydrogenase [Microlunatus sp. Y2014]|uniref:hydroxyacid dehydrogenase n=1 Tax=Microlunatus sp. Y2014 TaxID=3418488 RepID=UPI003DA74E04
MAPVEPSTTGRPRVIMAMASDALRDRLLTSPVRERLEAVADVIGEATLQSYDTPEARDLLGRADAVITGWGAPRMTPEVLSYAPDLRLVAHAAGTVRGVFDPGCYARGVMVTTAAEANAWPVAQWTLAMVLLAGKRALPRSRAAVPNGAPAAAPEPEPSVAAELGRDHWQTDRIGNYGVTVGVIGASRIGRLVIPELKRQGYRLLLSDPTLDAAEAAELGTELVPLDELMATSQIVTLHAPILESTKGMITAELLASMPDGATFINSARGILVDHDGLRTECASGRIDAILDVTWPEPLPADDVLWTLPNVWLTPHLAGAQGRELASLGRAAVAEVEALARREAYHFPVTAEQYERSA